jgi:hypothetical protein
VQIYNGVNVVVGNLAELYWSEGVCRKFGQIYIELKGFVGNLCRLIRG